MSLENNYLKRHEPSLGVPSNDDGYDGDIRLALLESGSVGLFGKVNGIWRKVSADLKIADSSGSTDNGGTAEEDLVTPTNQTSLNGIIIADRNTFRVSSRSGIAKGKSNRLILNDNVKINGKLTVNDGTSGNYYFITHNFDCTGTGAVYIPFGGSQIESAFTSDALDDETRFIAPFNGKLLHLKFQSASAPGQTDALLRVNGTDGAGALSFSAGHGTSANTTVNCTINTNANSFSAGDRLRIKIDPTNAPDEIAMTSVWVFDF